MPPNISILYRCVTDLLHIPVACKYLEDAGGYIISTGLVWPIETTEGETVFYYINTLDKEIRFLPDFSADLATAEIVTDQDKILFVFNHLLVYIQDANNREKITSVTKRVVLRGKFFGNFSLS